MPAQLGQQAPAAESSAPQAWLLAQEQSGPRSPLCEGVDAQKTQRQPGFLPLLGESRMQLGPNHPPGLVPPLQAAELATAGLVLMKISWSACLAENDWLHPSS